VDDRERADRVLREVADRLWRATYDRPVLRADPHRSYRPLRCAECRQRATDASGWRGVLVEFGEAKYVVVYCPGCSEGEFGAR